MSTSRISLKMDEPNELKFQLRINGETSEPEATKPQVRFLLVEKDNPATMGLVFPAGKTEDGLVLFSMPPLSGLVKAGAIYQGKVEVILGTRIFSPQIIEINFTKELSVEMVPVKQETEKELNLSKILEEVQDTKPTPKQITLTKSQLEKLLEKKRLVATGEKPKTAQPVKQANAKSPHPEKKKDESLKTSIKDLMKEALKD